MRRCPRVRAAVPARRRCGTRREHGSVTAEIAVALPCLVVILGAALACVHAAAVQLECVDAARVGARALARGDDVAAVEALVRQVGPRGATAELSTDAGLARVSVSAPVPLPADALSAPRVSGTAVVPAEPDR